MDENMIAKVAGTQRGVAIARQLHAAGFDNAAIKQHSHARPSIGCTAGSIAGVSSYVCATLGV
jgi:hypothetical protein